MRARGPHSPLPPLSSQERGSTRVLGWSAGAVLSALLLVAAACGDDDGAGGNGGRDGGGRDGSMDGAADTGPVLPPPPPPGDAGRPCVFALPVDIVFVIDNSNSMAEEQNNLALNFQDLMDVLTSPPDSDRDGEPDYPPVADLHIGITTTDLGVAGTAGVIGCEDPDGDDGQFVSMARGADPTCAGVSIGPPPWLQYVTGDDATQVAGQFSCIARLGTDGCGLEQQLESSLRAIQRTGPGMPNEGFLRDDSLVAVIYVTDEEDCSAADPSIFDPSPAANMRLGGFPTRCADHPELLHPVSRFIGELNNLALDRRGDVVVAAITGVPADLVANPTAIDYDALLADPRMQYRRDEMDDTQLAAACEVGGVAHAIPARRIVELVKSFAATGDGLVQSICSTDFRPAIRAIARLIATRICPPPI